MRGSASRRSSPMSRGPERALRGARPAAPRPPPHARRPQARILRICILAWVERYTRRAALKIDAPRRSCMRICMDWRSVRFDWNRARAFLVTAEEGSLSAAARALGLTQPTLGRQVEALEKE